ncbi:hypothetical protein ACQP2U_39230 [Nocardia sp. CA-084685]|uniref:hypothetical protein n=1 Tax=Nocardia sp. CA-084685 TaxID=3239970 RepID=UPI003D95B49F
MAEEAPFHPSEVAPSVRALLIFFHQDTGRKLDLAPVDSRPIYESADGLLMPVDEDGWITDFDSDLDETVEITSLPTRVIDTEAP